MNQRVKCVKRRDVYYNSLNPFKTNYLITKLFYMHLEIIYNCFNNNFGKISISYFTNFYNDHCTLGQNDPILEFERFYIKDKSSNEKKISGK